MPQPARPSMLETIDRVLAEIDPQSNPYFTALRDGTFAFDDFVETQVQFYYAVVFFSRPMATLAAKIPSARMRVEVLRNVWEEHGEGDVSRMHGETFKVLLQRMAGLEVEDIESRALWPEVRAFNTALIGTCALDDWEIGTGCLGMIERMFVDISRWIGQSIVDRGWLPADRLVHYDLHEKLDVRHSDDFFAVLHRAWDRGEPGPYLVEQGLRMGGYLFDQLYRGLHAARARREWAPMRLPQERVYAG
jgi:pyrroloquinoline-quinone synthase